MLSGLDIYSAVYQILNFFIAILFVIVVLVLMLFFLRLKNARLVAPDKKTGEHKILCYFFGTGGCYYELCRVSGNSVVTKKGGSYLVNPKAEYPSSYPPGQPTIVQVGVQATAYLEDEREPIVSKDMEEWIRNPDRKQITAYMSRTALNESFQKNILAMSEKVWADIAQMTKFIKNVPYMFYGMLILLLLLVINLYMTYTMQAQVNVIRSMWGG